MRKLEAYTTNSFNTIEINDNKIESFTARHTVNERSFPNYSYLKLGWWLPRKMIVVLQKVKKVIVVEELDPLETEIKDLA
jgi:TPP-dependent indolepyruvate ferredoxin oxidoreductase alpha subunit